MLSNRSCLVGKCFRVDAVPTYLPTKLENILRDLLVEILDYARLFCRTGPINLSIQR